MQIVVWGHCRASGGRIVPCKLSSTYTTHHMFSNTTLSSVCRFERLQGQQDFPLGAEGAGVIAALGPGVDSLQVGQPVACLSATFTEHAVVSAAACYSVQEASAAAAAMVLSGIFACGVIVGTGGVKTGTRVLIPAGAGALY